MTKKVLIMTQNFYPVIGSAGNRMKNIFQLLNQNNVEAHILTTEPAYPNKSMYKDRVFWDDEDLNKKTEKIIRVPIKDRNFSKNIIKRLFFFLEIMYRFILLMWKLRKEKYDYIYVSTPPIFIVFSAFFGKKLMKSRLILEVRDLWPDSLIGVKTFDNKVIINLFRILEKRMYKMAEYIVINSKGFTKHIKSKLKEDSTTPIIYLPNGPRASEIVETKIVDKEFRIIYAGNIGLAQDIDRLKLIARMLNDRDIYFDVIGYGVKADEFTEYIHSNDLNNVVLHKPSTRKKSLELIKNSKVAIAFLNDEDVFSTVLPGKLIDYMTCKTPIIAGVKGVAAKVITESQTGYVFEHQDVHAIVNQIVILKNNPQKLLQLEENCLSTVKEDFLWEKNINKLLDIIS
ncbi:glycosyltransferase family 4 protein [Pseudogracilibacillus auburnensis]|uniref:Glycosyl transferase family 1 domain-containing protein n=1 Tax=Pseudogracilibacillus auburnensis TaxID=1494959 RepID=A0A2V3W0S1_9BACI|nr:glycosyltransferase family 4 protein [Pseudogracilibacillus auburnensis]PXW85855.1 hypothetical protein DFR56_10917 [Pseudogracilibacillus auburnensis]